MAVDPFIFGVAYLDAETFRASAELFGVGMAFTDYPDTPDGDSKLSRVLQAASRTIDAFCGQVFTPDDIVETQSFDPETWQFSTNNQPVISISACVMRLGVTSTMTIPPNHLYINNQKGYVEIGRDYQAAILVSNTPLWLSEPQIEVTYKSAQSVPSPVKLACGYQAGHLINTGFVDKLLPANFGKLDIGGLSVNNKKGYRSSEEMTSGSLSPDAERILTPLKQFSVG